MNTSEPRYPLRLYLRQFPIKVMLGMAGLMNIASFVWLILHIRPQAVPLFLHYNVLFGVDLTGPWYAVFFVPLIGIAIILLNATLGWLLYQQDRFVSYVLLAIACLSNLFVLISAALIVFLNV